MSAFILVLDSSEEVVYDTIVKYIEKFSPKIFTKNLIIINNRATLQNHTMDQLVGRKVACDQAADSGFRSSLVPDLAWAATWKAASGQVAYSS